ncbi:MAG: hypothetical protein JWO19_2610 [Bryobacterales bacterium]|nr:hypothetical protein [Bryobacterales bacterium]
MATTLWLAIEGMVRFDDLFQFIRAKATHRTLQAIANEANPYPNGRETNNTAGMKTKATASKATVVVYPVPVDV